MPVTRARTSTSREPVVWPTYSKVAGTDCGCTVTTATSGGRMPACGCELAGSQPERSGTRNAADKAEAAANWKFLTFMSCSLLSVGVGLGPVQLLCVATTTFLLARIRHSVKNKFLGAAKPVYVLT